MPNQLAIPFRTTLQPPIQLAVQEHILNNHPNTSPDAFKWDISVWTQLREDATAALVHTNRVDVALKYHAQLVYILAKLPPDIGLHISYTFALSPSSPQVTTTLSNLIYERAAVVFNLASLYSQLALKEDRSHPDGIKRASNFYQHAAGCLSYLIKSILPQFLNSLVDQPPPTDLTEPYLRALEFVMLAQAQECVWQRAAMDRFKNGLIAKLSAKASNLYRAALQLVQLSPSLKGSFPPEWLVHIETKQLHFEAASQYRKSLEDLEGNRYGAELARLTEALAIAKKGYDIARRGRAAVPVTNDIKSLVDTLQKNVTRAERDNDFIYHKDVPAAVSLPPIQEASMVQSLTPAGLQDIKSCVNDQEVVFGSLLSWGVQVTVAIYKDRLMEWLKCEVFEPIKEQDHVMAQTLQALNLPASLEALDRPIGITPSLLKKAEEVRREDGPSRIDASIDNVELLAEQNRMILDEAMDILDQEASEDEGAQRSYTTNGKGKFLRMPSYEANKELTEREKRYRQVLEQAAESDETVRNKWYEWEASISRLLWTDDELEKWVPSSTGPSRTKPLDPQTLGITRQLRAELEALGDVESARKDLAQRLQRLSEADDIQPRIAREAAAIERWKAVEPEMFEDVLDQELSKYEKYKDNVDESRKRQEELLESIQRTNQLFLESRREDPTVKEREYALQSLDLAYHKYREIVLDLEEGLRFYNDLLQIMTNFRQACKDWVKNRRLELKALAVSDTMAKLGLSEASSAMASSSTVTLTPQKYKSHAKSPTLSAVDTPMEEDSEPPSPPPPVFPSTKHESIKRGANTMSFDLPNPNSEEWQSTPTFSPSSRPNNPSRGFLASLSPASHKKRRT